MSNLPSKDDSSDKMSNVVNVTSRTGEDPIFGHVPHVAVSEVDSKRVLRKIDHRIMPLLVGIYILSFIDKTLLNYSSIFGLQKALNLHGTQYSWTSSIFSFGYLIGQPIAGLIIQRYSHHIGKIVSSCVFIWSCIVLLTPLCHDFKGLAAIRFFLGVFESPSRRPLSPSRPLGGLAKSSLFEPRFGFVGPLLETLSAVSSVTGSARSNPLTLHSGRFSMCSLGP